MMQQIDRQTKKMMAGDEKNLLSTVLSRSKHRDIYGLLIFKNCKPDTI